MANPFKDWNEVTADEHNRRVAACKNMAKVCKPVSIDNPQGKPIPKAEFGEAYARAFATKPTSKPRKPLLNKTETRFLDLLKEQYQGRSIGIQSITLKLSFDCRYTPDFWIVPDHANDCDIPPSNTALLRFYEVKGPYIREDGMIKLKAAAALFPMFDFVIAQWKDGEWASKTIRPQ